MESLSPENVKRIAVFLDFKDMANLSKTWQSFKADLKPLIGKARKAVVAATMKENGKLKKVVTSLTRVFCHMFTALHETGPLEPDNDWDEDHTVHHVTNAVRRMEALLNAEFRFSDISVRAGYLPLWESDEIILQEIGSQAQNQAIVQHFLNEMD
jgi:hypothetical protein